MDPSRLVPGDPTLIANIVNDLKAKGFFDEFRHECLADVDTKSSCQNLSQRVDGYTSKFLAALTWHPDLNKNELRNKLRQHIDQSGMLAVGADHVVEQVLGPKIPQLLPKIGEIVHRYIQDQTEQLNKKSESFSIDSSTEKPVSDSSDINFSKAKTCISDPIADILSFTYAKPKPTITSSSQSVQQKHADLKKKRDDESTDFRRRKDDEPPDLKKKKEEESGDLKKKKDEESVDPKRKKEEDSVIEKKKEEKSTLELIEPVNDNLAKQNEQNEAKIQNDREKVKREIKIDEAEASPDGQKKIIREEVKPEKRKTEDVKGQISESVSAAEENKASSSLSIKQNASSKKDVDKNKKVKSVNVHKISGSSKESKDGKKTKRESSDKLPEKHTKAKLLKAKESGSPSKSISSSKNIPSKEEKSGEISKSKIADSGSNNKTSDLSGKKSKANSSKKDNSSSKLKRSSEKVEKIKIAKLGDQKNDQNHHDSANNDRGTKSTHYSSSYDSSQGSDQEKNSSINVKKEKEKHFSKHASKGSSKKLVDKSAKTSDRKRSNDVKESSSKQYKNEKSLKTEKLKETAVLGEAAKISSRSNSFGSTSSVSSSSNTSKDNSISASDEISENSAKGKKKKAVKEKDQCHSSETLQPPPPPPPPPSGSLTRELTSSMEISSTEDIHSSSDSEESSCEDISEESSSDSEIDSKNSVSNALNKSEINSSVDDINAFYDIFLYSSSSSEFEGYGYSPEKKKTVENIFDSDITVSSVHTSDLSSYDDELSDDDLPFNETNLPREKKRLTVREAEQLLRNKAALQHSQINKNVLLKGKSNCKDSSVRQRPEEKSAVSSSDDEPSPSEPKRSLRRERKLNPRYASNEYTSIFNSRKETFITKQVTPVIKNQTPNSTPSIESKYKKKELVADKNKVQKKGSDESLGYKIDDEEDNDDVISGKVENAIAISESCVQEEDASDVSEMPSSDEMESIIDREPLLQETDNKHNDRSSSDPLKEQLKLKPQNNSKLNINSYSVKRKHKMSDTSASKRPCSRSSVDSSCSDFATNENKPFNSEKQNVHDEKLLRADLTEGIKRDLFCKQRTSNNGDILGQKEILLKNSHGKLHNVSEKKTNDSETSTELSVL